MGVPSLLCLSFLILKAVLVATEGTVKLTVVGKFSSIKVLPEKLSKDNNAALVATEGPVKLTVVGKLSLLKVLPEDAPEDSNSDPEMQSSCRDWQKINNTSGVRLISVNGTSTRVYCDQDTDGGGWLVFQRRQDGSVDFYRGWDEYRAGFGDPEGEFWLGLDTLHAITSSKQYNLRVDLKGWDGKEGYAEYTGFRIGSRESKYTLSYSSFINGSAGDSLSYHKGPNKGQKFSAYDADNDGNNYTNCAVPWHGGWWYNSCGVTNLNGRYKSGDVIGWDGVVWQHLYNRHVSLKFTEMKIRPA